MVEPLKLTRVDTIEAIGTKPEEMAC